MNSYIPEGVDFSDIVGSRQLDIIDKLDGIIRNSFQMDDEECGAFHFWDEFSLRFGSLADAISTLYFLN